MAGLSAEQWSEISPHLDQALDLDPNDRERFLVELTIAKPELARVLRDFIATHENNVAEQYLEQSPIDRPAEPVAGETVAAYTLESLLGIGGMGSVWLARRSDGQFDAKVAIKLLKQHGHGPQGSEQIRREASLLARLSHPNIARVFDAGLRASGQAFLILEYVEGERIDQYCDKRALSPIDRLRLYLQVLEAVADAHSQQIVHRDIKPSNILVTRAGVVKLLDFGVALLQSPLTPADVDLASQNVPGLTPGYASPEQIRSEAVTPASDVYALGILLHVLIAGQHPYASAASTNTQLAHAALNQDAEMASQSMESPASRWARGDLDAIIAKAINREAALRYTTAADLAADVRLFLARRPVMARPQSMANRMLMIVQRRWSENRSASLILLVAIVLSVGVAMLKYGQNWHEKPTAANAAMSGVTPPEKSVAVLPFVDMSEKKDQEYFSDGLSEELIDMLAKVPDLRVPARTSSFYFKGKQATITEIARTLGVAHVLEGSVRKAGNTLRVTAQLIRADNGYHLWSETYNREVSDVFKLQDEIAEAVVGVLKVKLLLPPSLEGSRGTKSLAAYSEFLLGRQFMNRRRLDDLRRAVEAYSKATELDPTYAAAFAELVIAQVYLSDLTGDELGRNKAEASADRAVELAPERAEGYSARGWLRTVLKWDWAGAEDDLKRATALDPSDSVALNRLCSLRLDLGRVQEAIACARRAIELDPLAAKNWSDLSDMYTALGDYPAARVAAIRALEIQPEDPFALIHRAEIELLEGRAAEALQFYGKVDPKALRLMGTALAEHALFHEAASDAALGSLIEKYANSAAFQIALIYAWRGNNAVALDWLERAYRQRDGGLEGVKTDALLRSIRGEQRYQALLRKMNLSE